MSLLQKWFWNEYSNTNESRREEILPVDWWLHTSQKPQCWVQFAFSLYTKTEGEVNKQASFYKKLEGRQKVLKGSDDPLFQLLLYVILY